MDVCFFFFLRNFLSPPFFSFPAQLGTTKCMLPHLSLIARGPDLPATCHSCRFPPPFMGIEFCSLDFFSFFS